MSAYSILQDQSESITVRHKDISIEAYDPYESVLANSIYADSMIEIKITEELKRLKEKWLEDTKYESGYKSLINHPAFIKVVSFGERIIPYLVKDMIETKTPWFYALHEITGEDPVKNESRGKIDLVIEDWFRWAKEQDYV